MDCDQFAQAKVLAAYGEGPRAPDLQAHLAQCASCALDVEEMREIRQQYAEASTDTMPDPLRRRLLALRPTVARPPAWQRWFTLTAAALLLAVLTAPLFQRDRQVKPPESPAPEAIDLSFPFESVDLVRASMPEEQTFHPPVYESEVDRELRDLKDKLSTLEDYW